MKKIPVQKYNKLTVGKIYEFETLGVKKEKVDENTFIFSIFSAEKELGKLIRARSRQVKVYDSNGKYTGSKKWAGEVAVFSPLQDRTPEGQKRELVCISCNMFKIYEVSVSD